MSRHILPKTADRCNMLFFDLAKIQCQPFLQTTESSQNGSDKEQGAFRPNARNQGDSAISQNQSVMAHCIPCYNVPCRAMSSRQFVLDSGLLGEGLDQSFPKAEQCENRTDKGHFLITAFPRIRLSTILLSPKHLRSRGFQFAATRTPTPGPIWPEVSTVQRSGWNGKAYRLSFPIYGDNHSFFFYLRRGLPSS